MTLNGIHLTLLRSRPLVQRGRKASAPAKDLSMAAETVVKYSNLHDGFYVPTGSEWDENTPVRTFAKKADAQKLGNTIRTLVKRIDSTFPLATAVVTADNADGDASQYVLWIGRGKVRDNS